MCLVAQSCSTLCDPLDCGPSGSSVHGDSPGKNTGASRHALLQGILTALNTGSIPTIVTDFFFKFHYPGFHFGGLKKKKKSDESHPFTVRNRRVHTSCQQEVEVGKNSIFGVERPPLTQKCVVS